MKSTESTAKKGLKNEEWGLFYQNFLANPMVYLLNAYLSLGECVVLLPGEVSVIGVHWPTSGLTLGDPVIRFFPLVVWLGVLWLWLVFIAPGASGRRFKGPGL